MVAMCSGVRIEFDGVAETIELEADVTSFRYVDQPARPQVFQLVIDDEQTMDAAAPRTHVFVVDRDDPPGVRVEEGGTTVVRFETSGAARITSALWLPHGSTLRIKDLRVDDGAVIRSPDPSARRRWVHCGSSISHCLEADVPTGTWPAIAARRTGVELHSLGFAGQCHLDPFVARTIRDMPAEVISLKVGINIVNDDSLAERAFVPAVHGFLDAIRDGHPITPIIVVSPINCPIVEDHPGPTVADWRGNFRTLPGCRRAHAGSLTLRQVRALLEGLVTTRQRTDPNITYLDGLRLFGENDAQLLVEGLHPSAAGYALIGPRFAELAGDVLSGP